MTKAERLKRCEGCIWLYNPADKANRRKCVQSKFTCQDIDVCPVKKGAEDDRQQTTEQSV